MKNVMTFSNIHDNKLLINLAWPNEKFKAGGPSYIGSSKTENSVII